MASSYVHAGHQRGHTHTLSTEECTNPEQTTKRMYPDRLSVYPLPGSPPVSAQGGDNEDKGLGLSYSFSWSRHGSDTKE